MRLKLPSILISLSFTTATTAQTLYAILASQNATLSMLNSFLEQEQALMNSIDSTSDITVLAPSNKALSGLPQSVVNKVSSDPAFLEALLSYHILDGVYYTSNFTAAGGPMAIQTLLNSSDFAQVEGGQRVIADVGGAGGAVRLWSGAAGPAAMEGSDFNFTSGTLHILDSLLTMPTNLTNTLLNANLTAAVGAIRQSNMAEELSDQPEMTVFAPNNAAFEVIGSLISGMTPNDLETVLGYHVIQNRVLYSGMVNTLGAGEVIEEGTMQGGMVSLRGQEGGSWWVNGARVVRADMLIANGVVHVIDGVLNPRNPNAVPDPAAATPAPAFSGASATGGIPFTTGITPPGATSGNAGTPTATITVGPAVATAMAAPRRTGAVAAAAIFGGAVVLMNL